MLNLCHPDGKKSCVACCGMYNVPDATRDTLQKKLEIRTDLFARTERSIEALTEYESYIRESENNRPLIEIVHVCEFTGFVDSDRRLPGCMLHPSAPGNEGVDLRGLCHYGSMACKTFYCPACESLDPAVARLIIDLLDDWHLYGLVITDVDFVTAVSNLFKPAAGVDIASGEGPHGAHVESLKEMLSWKSSRRFHQGSRYRRSRYYFKESPSRAADDPNEQIEAIVSALQSTYDVRLSVDEVADDVRRLLEGSDKDKVSRRDD